MSPHEEPRKVSSQLSLRPAEEKDCEILWQWRNEENTRRWSFNSDYIPYEEHKHWFSSKLHNAGSLILIVSDNSRRDIGQVRFDTVPDGNVEVNISIIDSERGKGCGSTALKIACPYAVGELKVTGVVAHIKEENKASTRAFTKAGFMYRGSQDFKGNKVAEMVWEPKP